jgi:hypothetical protein
VKQESERRKRDRERSTQPEWTPQQSVSALDQLLEEEFQPARSVNAPKSYHSDAYNTPAYSDDIFATTNGHKDPAKSIYGQRPSANPPNTLSLTNVNIPTENVSSTTNKYTGSTSIYNNDYSSNRELTSSVYSDRYNAYKPQISQITALPTSKGYSIKKLSSSVPYLDGAVETETTLVNGTITTKVSSTSSLTKTNAELSPVFTSETAKQIIIEMVGEKNGVVKNESAQYRRSVPREKRRHYTAPHHQSAKSLDATSPDDDIFSQEVGYFFMTYLF